jgi:MFS family permease
MLRPLFDRYGCGVLAAVGSLGHVLMLLSLAVCREYWQFMLCLGFLGGITSAILTTTALATVSHWFRDRRGLATGIAMLGSSVGGMVIPLMLRVTLSRHGWTSALRILALVTLGCLIVGYVCIQTRLPPDLDKRAVIDLEIFRDPRFVFTTIGIFCIEVVLFGTLGLMPSYVRSQGFPGSSGSFQIAVVNSASCFGRIFGGVLSDSFGRFNMILLMMVAALLTCLVVWLPSGHHLPLLYLFSALFGFESG